MKTFAFAAALALAFGGSAHAEDTAAPKAEDAAPAAKEATEDAAETTVDPAAATALLQKDLIRRHHEGDVAMGVCGGRTTALMWFYQTSIDAGRDDLQSALESVQLARETIKSEAERRALDDGVDTTVRVMNDQTALLWNELIEASEKDDKAFQEAYDGLFAGVEECLKLFFPTEAKAETAEPEAEGEPEADAESKDAAAEEKSDSDN